jgi:hypothetical protein
MAATFAQYLSGFTIEQFMASKKAFPVVSCVDVDQITDVMHVLYISTHG